MKVITRLFVVLAFLMGSMLPILDGEEVWFGHDGAWITYRVVNWHKKQMHMWVQQRTGGLEPWEPANNEAMEKFFSQHLGQLGFEVYTERTSE